jgi:hypothetical protein
VYVQDGVVLQHRLPTPALEEGTRTRPQADPQRTRGRTQEGEEAGRGRAEGRQAIINTHIDLTSLFIFVEKSSDSINSEGSTAGTIVGIRQEMEMGAPLHQNLLTSIGFTMWAARARGLLRCVRTAVASPGLSMHRALSAPVRSLSAHTAPPTTTPAGYKDMRLTEFKVSWSMCIAGCTVWSAFSDLSKLQSVSLWLLIRQCTYIRTHTPMRVLFLLPCVCVCMNTCTCTHVCIFTRTQTSVHMIPHTHTHTHTHTHMHVYLCAGLSILEYGVGGSIRRLRHARGRQAVHAHC